MSWFDNVVNAVDGGMNSAEKAARKAKLQGDLSALARNKETALAALGRAVASGESGNSAFLAKYTAQLKAVSDIEAQELSVQNQIEALQRADVVFAPGAIDTINAADQGTKCPSCGRPVALSAPCCPACGDNLANLKARYRVCPKCNRYYPANFSYCQTCGVQTQPLPVGPAGTPVATRTCPRCGRPLQPGVSVCATCGATV